MAFDPDAYLADKGASTQSKGFDPDAYLQSKKADSVSETEERAKTKEPNAGKIPDTARATGLGMVAYTNPILDLYLKKHDPALSEKLQSATEGALNTTTLGVSDFAAKKSGADLNSAESPRFREPYANATGEVAGALLPSAGFKGANTVGSAIKAGAKTGGVYGLVSGATNKAMDDNATTSDIIKSAVETGLAGTALGAALPAGVAGVSKLAEKVNPESIRGLLRDSAEKDVAQMLDATGIKNKKAAERITAEILNRPIGDTLALTREGMQQKAEQARAAAGEALNEIGTLKGEVSPAYFVNKLEALKEPYVVDGKVIDQGAVDRIQGIQDVFGQYGDAISSEGLRKIRKTFDDEIYSNKGVVDIGQKSMLSIKKSAADEIRRVLASEHPDMAEANKVFSFYATLDDLLDSAITRKKPQKGLLSNLGAMAGATVGSQVAGMPGAATGAVIGKGVMSAMYSPAWKLVTAKAKNNLANMLAKKEYSSAAELLSKQGIETPELESLVKLTRPKQSNPIDIGGSEDLLNQKTQDIKNELMLKQLMPLSEEQTAKVPLNVQDELLLRQRLGQAPQ
jgi:hypothetical protein